MTNPTNTDIKADVGDVWNAFEGTTTTLVNSLITKAQTKVKQVTGTTTGDAQDLSIRALADAYSVQHALGGMGPETVDDKNLVEMRNRFNDEAVNALKVIGKSLDGKSVKFSQVNP